MAAVPVSSSTTRSGQASKFEVTLPIAVAGSSRRCRHAGKGAHPRRASTRASCRVPRCGRRRRGCSRRPRGPGRSVPAGASAGAGSMRHCEVAFGQRGRNGHSSPSVARSGGWPRIAVSFSARSRRGRLCSSPKVYGCRGRRKIVRTSPVSTTLPAYITTTRSASRATTPKSCVIKQHAASAVAQRLEARDRLEARGGVEVGGRLVGDDHVGAERRRHHDHHALRHAAGELERVGAGGTLRVREHAARAGAVPRP